MEDGGEGGAGGQAEADEVAAGEKGRGDEGLRGGGEFGAFLKEELVVVEATI